MNKKGFTLVELLAVIAVLAILVIIALPNVVNLYNEAKRNSFATELKEIYKTALNQWMSDTMSETMKISYGRYNSDLDCIDRQLPLSGRQELLFGIVIDKGGKVINFVATDNTYYYSFSGSGSDPLLIEEIDNGKGTIVRLAEIGKFGASFQCNSDNTFTVLPE